MKQELRPELRQELKLTLELRTLLQIIQLPLTELEIAVRQEVQQNPFLEMKEKKEVSFDEVVEELDRIRERQERTAYFGRSVSEEREEGLFDNIPAREKSIYQHLYEQIGLMNFSQEEKGIAYALLSYIDRRGFIMADEEEIAKELDVEVNKIRCVLERMKKEVEPTGLICRDIKERLKIQAEERGADNKVMKIIENYLEYIKKGKVKEIAEEMEMDEEEVREVVNFIKSLDPKPERNFAEELNREIIPDAILKVKGEDIEIEINDGYLPELTINTSLYRRLKEALGEGNETARKEIEFMYRRARGFYRLKLERRKNLEKVIKEIVEHNKEYFLRKTSSVKPLTLQELAEKVGVHKSTLSRMIADKYIDTPTGVYPLKRFFTSKLRTVSGGVISSDYVRKKIKELIENELPERPLSDQMIADILRREGIWVARRTVAKYREEMNIPSSGERKRLSS